MPGQNPETETAQAYRYCETGRVSGTADMGGDGGFCAAAFKRKAAGEIRNGGRRSEKGESGIKNRERKKKEN